MSHKTSDDDSESSFELLESACIPAAATAESGSFQHCQTSALVNSNSSDESSSWSHVEDVAEIDMTFPSSADDNDGSSANNSSCSSVSVARLRNLALVDETTGNEAKEQKQEGDPTTQCNSPLLSGESIKSNNEIIEDQKCPPAAPKDDDDGLDNPTKDPTEYEVSGPPMTTDHLLCDQEKYLEEKYLEVMARARKDKKLVLVSIQDYKEIASHVIHRDILENELFQDLATEKFIFWQTNPQNARLYIRIFRIKQIPHLAILHPIHKCIIWGIDGWSWNTAWKVEDVLQSLVSIGFDRYPQKQLSMKIDFDEERRQPAISKEEQRRQVKQTKDDDNLVMELYWAQQAALASTKGIIDTTDFGDCMFD